MRVLEIGCGNSHVLARAFFGAANVAVTFVDPGSDFNAFPRRVGYEFVTGLFPGELESREFDVVYSSRCLHCNTPSGMITALRAVRSALEPTAGRFYLETTSARSEFYTRNSGLAAYFRSRRKEPYPGFIAAAEFAKHWPGWTVGDVTLLCTAAALRGLLLASGFGAVEGERAYWIRNAHGDADETLFAVAAA